ncbi:hypothetical protein, partial [Corynebacterium durum]
LSIITTWENGAPSCCFVSWWHESGVCAGRSFVQMSLKIGALIFHHLPFSLSLSLLKKCC